MKPNEKNFYYRLAVLLLALPLATISLGFDTLADPDYDDSDLVKPQGVRSLPSVQKRVARGPASAIQAAAAAGESEGLDKSDVKDVSPAEAEKYGVQEFGIIVTDKGYFPNKVVVRRNIPVNLFLTATDSQNLCFVMKQGENSFRRGVGPKRVEKISFKPTEPGPVDFHCPIHNIKGKLIVRD